MNATARARKPHKVQCGSCPDRLKGDKRQVIAEDSETTEEESSTDEEERWKDVARAAEIPADYYNIQKLVKYIKSGNQTATIVALCCMQDYDLKVQINQFAIQDIGGLDVLVNILECNDSKCSLGALSVLSDITMNIDIRKTIVDLDGIPLIVDVLNSALKELKTRAAETLAHVGKVRLARKYVRNCNGISKLVDLLDIKMSILVTPLEQLTVLEVESLHMARGGARALWTLADSKHNMEQMRKSGIVPLMANLLKSVHIDVVIPIMGTVRKCSSQPKFQLAITTEGMITDIVRYLRMDNIDLKVECCMALNLCATDATARDQIREAEGLQPLVNVIKDKTIRENKPLLRGATGAIWMCATTDANIKEMEDMNVIFYLVALLNDDCDEVLTNVAGAISECVRFSENRRALNHAGGLPLLVALLNSSHAPLLENLATTIKECAQDPDCMLELEANDAVRLVWSLLKNTSPRVQAKAAYAICPCVKYATDSAELVRSLVGAMELVVGLLRSKEIMVLSAVCSAISTIALDQTNLAILTDLRVIYKLSDLVNTTDDNLRMYLAAAVASCACYGTNTEEFGRLRTVTPIVTYMTSDNPEVHRTTAMALEKLSMDPQNCITMHQSGVVPFLLECIGSTNKELQLAAAGCLRNIRELALRAEEYMLKIDDD